MSSELLVRISPKDLKNKIQIFHNVKKIPLCKCQHSSGTNFKMFVILMGVQGLVEGCTRDCLNATVLQYVLSDHISCVNCFKKIDSNSKTKIVQDPDQNEYLCCSIECVKNYRPSKFIKCNHVESSTYMAEDMTHQTQIYRNSDTTLFMRRVCSNCSTNEYPLAGEQHFNCLDCLKKTEIIEAKVYKNIATNTSYVFCSTECADKYIKEQMAHLCAKCGLAGQKRCGICKWIYCSAECQLNDWPEHKKICKIPPISPKLL
jgi:hypothetical protein